MRDETLRVGPSNSSVALELALDEALLVEADAGRGRPVLRFWEPPGLTLVLGASCRLADDVHLDACRTDMVSILRRTSGGGTVALGPGTLNVSVILPQSAAPGLSAVDRAHRHVLEWIARSIQRAGLPVALAGRGDLVLGDRKCGGSAQRRLKHWFMVHCSILYDFPLERIDRYLAVPRRQPEYRQGRDHRDFLSNLALPRNILMDAICSDQMAGSLSINVPDAPPALVHSLLSEKFANRAWVERL